MTSQPDFVDYAPVKLIDRPLLKTWDRGQISMAGGLVYNSVEGARAEIKRLKELKRDDLASLFRCALKMLEHEEHIVSKRRLIEAELKKLDPTFQVTVEVARHCCAKGCTQRIEAAYIMCVPHWMMVPRELQRPIIKQRRLNQSDTEQPPEYLAMVQAAVDAVAVKEGTASDAMESGVPIAPERALRADLLGLLFSWSIENVMPSMSNEYWNSVDFLFAVGGRELDLRFYDEADGEQDEARKQSGGHVRARRSPHVDLNERIDTLDKLQEVLDWLVRR